MRFIAYVAIVERLRAVLARVVVVHHPDAVLGRSFSNRTSGALTTCPHGGTGAERDDARHLAWIRRAKRLRMFVVRLVLPQPPSN